MTIKFVFSSILLIIGLSASGQEKSNKGREFWLGYGFNYGFNRPDGSTLANSQTLVLYLSTDAPANVTVSVSNTGWSQSVFIPANTVNAAITIPKNGAADARIINEGLSDRAIRVVSDTPIVAYAHLYNSLVSGATMLMPAETFGFKYFSLNYSQSTSAYSPPTSTANFTQNGPDWYSWFYIVAPEDSTCVLITPSDTTMGGWLPGQTYTVYLNKGQIYNVMGKLINGNSALWAASKDLTGSKIVSVPGGDGICHPVTVFSGSSGIRLCRGDGGEYMQQQVFPTQAWGTRYVTYHTLNNTNTNINDPFKNFYRIAVSDPAAVVKRNGIPLTGIINNFYYEYLDSLGGDYIESDKPILVAQYTPGGNRCYNSSQLAYGDPEMFYLSSLEQGKNDVLFYATRNAFIDYNYLNVIIPTPGVASLRLNGNPFLPANIRPHPNMPGYSVAVARMTGPSGQHRLRSDSNFNAIVYGLGYFESYGYNVGTNINNLDYFSEIKNSGSSQAVDTITCPDTEVNIFVKLAYQANSITWRLSDVPGIVPGTDITLNNPVPVRTEVINGRTYYVYSLQQTVIFSDTGTFHIPISYTATVIENCSQTEYATIQVKVIGGPEVDYNITGNFCPGDTIRLSGVVQPGSLSITNYNWYFQDNSLASGLNTTRFFNNPGTETVRFEVIAENGCRADTTKSIIIKERPDAAFGVSGFLCSGDTILISDSSTFLSGNIQSWNWSLGNNTSTQRNDSSPFPVFYQNPGTYVISLVATADNGCKSDSAFQSVTIKAKPVADFSHSAPVCLGDSVLFTDNSVTQDGSIQQWNWSFGDNTTLIASNGNDFYHTYPSTGVFSASLTVTASNGCRGISSPVQVSVNDRPSASISFTGIPCIDSLFQFTSSLPFDPANPATYYWSFGDGSSSQSNSSNVAEHSYNSALSGLTVYHIAGYGQGCLSDTSRITIPVISPNPVVSFEMMPDNICAGESVMFNSTLSNSGLTWSWNFGNGTGTQQPPFVRTFASEGNYQVNLFVTNNAGCNSETITETLTVNPLPPVNAGSDKIIQTGDRVVLDATLMNASDYQIQWSPSTYLNNAGILNPVSIPDSSIVYMLTATNSNTGCSQSDLVKITVVYDLFIPNSFTPNNDGINDRWGIPGLAAYPDAEVFIYSRYGQLIFRGKNYASNPWNGYFNGTLQPQGAYVYVIKVDNGNYKTLKGTLLLIR